jgi:HSP20 family protein
MNELVRWDPFRAVAPFEDSFFAIPSLFGPLAVMNNGPRMDVAEKDGAYQLAIELPGVKKEAIQVNVLENSVTVNAELPEEQTGNDVQWLLRERSFGKLTRTIALPEALDEEASEARYADGVLYLTLKKKSATQAKRLTVH